MPLRAKLALAGAAAATGLLAFNWAAALHIGLLAQTDANVLTGFGGLWRPKTASIANFVAGLCNPDPYLYLACVPVAVAIRRRRPRTALAIVAILLGANLTTEVLKPLLAQPRPAFVLAGKTSIIGTGSWPSGHATAAMALALCAVLAAPARARPLVASIGSVFAVAVSYSFMTLGWHLPSDVLGGFLVAAVWTLLGIAALIVADARWPRRVSTQRQREQGPASSLRDVVGPLAVAWIGVLGLAALVILARPHQVAAYAHTHKTFVVGAAAIGALGLALATSIVLMLRAATSGSGPAPTAARTRSPHSLPG